MANIDDFKANLIGGGARANQYRVTVVPPPGIATGLDIRRTSFAADTHKGIGYRSQLALIADR